MRVLLTATAERDLEAIADYIAADSPAHALAFVRILREKCSELADFPPRFPIVPRYADREIRRRVHGSYVILYRIDGDVVIVLRVMSGAQDYEGQLGSDPDVP